MEGRLSRIPVHGRLHRPEPSAGECGARRDTQGRGSAMGCRGALALGSSIAAWLRGGCSKI